MGTQVLMQGNYLNDTKPVKPNRPLATAIEYEGEEGKCWLKVVEVVDLDFKVDWKPYSRSGYQQGMRVPPGHTIDMAGAVVRWNWVIPENGSIHFCKTKEERDGNLIND